jgi:3,5-epimerase/4-reductase
MIKVITFGKNGFISNHLPYPIMTDRLEANDSQIRSILEREKPDVVINGVGSCGFPNIDSCEKNKEKTYLANTVIPSILASECNKLDVCMIHLASGCIFYGESPNTVNSPDVKFNKIGGSLARIDAGWKETDFAHPVSYYSKTKYAADLILGEMSNCTVLRIRMPISSKHSNRNFITKVRKYSHVIDTPNSMTFLDDLVRCVGWTIENNKTGIYHVVNPGLLTAAEVMDEYKKYDPSHEFAVISSSELDKLTLAKRSNCVLNADKLRSEGFIMRDSKEALKSCMADYIRNI